MIRYRTLEDRIPARHPPVKLRELGDAILASMGAGFDALYADCGRSSTPPKRLRGRLIQRLFSIRCERQLVSHLDYNQSRLCYNEHAWMENRNGLVVDARTIVTSRTAEREAAKTMVARSVTKPATLGTDKGGYDVADFVIALRESKVTRHVSQKAKVSAIDGRTTRHAGYKSSLKIRKRIEEVFGWSKTVGGLRKTRLAGLAKASAKTVFTFAVYNLTRTATLFGWRLSVM